MHVIVRDVQNIYMVILSLEIKRKIFEENKLKMKERGRITTLTEMKNIDKLRSYENRKQIMNFIMHFFHILEIYCRHIIGKLEYEAR